MQKVLINACLLVCVGIFPMSVQALLYKDVNVNSDTQTYAGMITIAYDAKTDSVFLELNKTQLDKSFIFQSSLPQGIGSNDIGLDRGQLGNTRLVRFLRFGNKILLKQINTQYRALSNNIAEQKSIDEAFADSVIAGFEISSENDHTLRINYTDFLQSDIHGIVNSLSRSAQGNYSIDKTRSGIYLPRTKAFEKNIELESVVTYTGSPLGQYIQDVTPDASSVTVHLHHSFVALPDDNYKTREFHPYSGFWKHSFMDYSVPIDANMERKLIPRHRLQKKDPSAAMSEAANPIIYYLDPGIPEPVMSALKEGALWWEQAFTAAGYKNAFQVKVLPEDADPMDVRYNVIQWVHRATRGWSYGSSVIDPRTGEIIKGHVTLGSLRVRQDFLIATGFTAPYTQTKQQSKADTSAELALALDRIRQLSAHEVGHTLGIAHNFAASENNRASVMDYPHPLITLDNDKIDLSNAYAKGMGDWDLFTIAYGYQEFMQGTNESSELQALINQAKQAGLLYKSDPDARVSKRASSDGHLWDNGSDPIAEFERVTELRQYALQKFGSNNLPTSEDFSDLERRLVPLYYSHRFQLDALVKQISGVKYEYTVKEGDNEPDVKFVDGNKQTRALALLLNSASPEYLALPTTILGLIPPKAYGSDRTRESMPTRMGIAFDPITAAESVAGYSLHILLQSERLNRLAFQHSINKDIPSIKVVGQQLFDKLIKNNDEDRLSQRLKLIALSVYFESMSDPELSIDAKLDMQSVLVDYQKWLKKNANKLSNAVLLIHIEHYWAVNNWPLSTPIKAMPPGSPI